EEASEPVGHELPSARLSQAGPKSLSCAEDDDRIPVDALERFFERQAPGSNEDKSPHHGDRCDIGEPGREPDDHENENAEREWHSPIHSAGRDRILYHRRCRPTESSFFAGSRGTGLSGLRLRIRRTTLPFVLRPRFRVNADQVNLASPSQDSRTNSVA